RVDVGKALGLGEETLGLGDHVVAADQDTERAGLRGTGVGRQGVVRAGDLEGGDLIVAVVEEFVVDLGGSGQGVERVVDGGVVVPGTAFDRVEVTVDRGFDRFGGGTYLGSGGLSTDTGSWTA
ncbi:hypothetical protein JHN61_25305, partial [Streptomyces sp. MBT67]|nr:hypothetical protein [Streptomyces sp. MBT67]